MSLGSLVIGRRWQLTQEYAVARRYNEITCLFLFRSQPTHYYCLDV